MDTLSVVLYIVIRYFRVFDAARGALREATDPAAALQLVRALKVLYDDLLRYDNFTADENAYHGNSTTRLLAEAERAGLPAHAWVPGQDSPWGILPLRRWVAPSLRNPRAQSAVASVKVGGRRAI